MARPTAKDLTERELELMHVFWQHDDISANEARDLLAESGIDRAYVTVANLVRILVDKKCLEATNSERPFRYRTIRSFSEISRGFVFELVQRVFQGSREQMLVQLFGGRKKLTKRERELLTKILEDES